MAADSNLNQVKIWLKNTSILFRRFSVFNHDVWLLYQPTRSSYFTTAMKNSHCNVKRMFDVYWIDRKPKSLGSQMLPKQPIAVFVWKSFSFHCTALTFFALATTQLCRLPVPALFWRVFGPKTYQMFAHSMIQNPNALGLTTLVA